MSDYLNNIVLRSLNVAAVVQPRVRQLFEQAPAPPVTVAPLQTDVAAVSPVVGAEIPEASGLPIRHEETTAVHPLFHADRTSGVEKDLRVPDFQPPVVAQTVRPARAQNEDIAPARVISPASTVAAPYQETLPPALQNELKAQPHSQRNQPSTAVAPVSKRPSRTTSISNGILPSLPPNTSAEPHGLPIRISIGRVDVRAIMPSGPPKAAPSHRPKPALSLESYLKQREEGKR